ncbi:hypothetical protein [Candidatus Thiosymbion oneisti]|uniref:hypothetical protein n=1 Tax=Candidatus Thiosymbion oneisti TaxID=589554 RepID=UPI000B7E462C|nr:hypothetical protein [Candidatus Thiosymbion oneisti]
MQPIRQILEDAPDAIPVPEELRHRRVEYILWSLDEDADKAKMGTVSSDYERSRVDRIEIPSRKERNARR